jgi:hypothetical protein
MCGGGNRDPAPRRWGAARRVAWVARASALALAALAPLAAARGEAHFRLRPSVQVGGAWGSDLFLGAGLGPSAQAQIASALTLDASLSSRIKPFSEYDLALGLYESTRGISVDQSLALGSRFRLGPGLWGELALEGQLRDLSVAQTVSDAVGLEASHTRGIAVAPAVRWWAAGFLLEVSALLSYRQLVLQSGEPIADLSAAAAASCGRTFGPVSATLALRAVGERSGAPSFSYGGGSALLSLRASVLPRLEARFSCALHRNLFALGRADTLLRASLSPALRIAEHLWAEASYGYAINASTAPEFGASRHFVYAGVKIEGDLWRR